MSARAGKRGGNPQSVLNGEHSLVGAAPEGQFKIAEFLDVRPIHQNIREGEQGGDDPVVEGTGVQSLKGIAGIGHHGFAHGLDLFRYVDEGCRLQKGLTAGKSHAGEKRIFPYLQEDCPGIGQVSAIKAVRFGIVAALASVGAALCEDHKPKAGSIGDRLVYNAIEPDFRHYA